MKIDQDNYFFKKMPSPFGGPLTLVRSPEGIAGILFPNERKGRVVFPRLSFEENQKDLLLLKAESQLNEYFSGKRISFDLPLAPRGTPFQKRVWNQLPKIPFGKTESYGALARRLGDLKWARAVGAANGKNPISIIVPCHRVIGANGDLVGFGGGLKAKEYLLRLEKKEG